MILKKNGMHILIENLLGATKGYWFTNKGKATYITGTQDIYWKNTGEITVMMVKN